MATYTDAKLSNFPDKIDDIPRLSDVSADNIDKVNAYNALMASGDFAAANELLDEDLAKCLFTADTYNKLRDAIIAVERSFKDDVATLIGEAVGIVDDPTSTQASVTTYSSKKIEDLLDEITLENLHGVEYINATSDSYDMDQIIRSGAHCRFYRTGKTTLNTPYTQGDMDTWQGATILSCTTSTTYGVQVAFRSGCMPAYRTLSNGILSKWNWGYVRLNGNSTVNGKVTVKDLGLTNPIILQTDLGNTKETSVYGTSATTQKLGVTGVLPVVNGGTGNSKVDTTPTKSSSKMVTSGGVYTALDKKFNKAAGEDNALNEKLWIEKSSYPGIVLSDKTYKSRTALENYGTAAVLSMIDNYEDETNKNRRRFILRDSSSANHPKLSEALALHDYYYDSDGKEHGTYYNLFGEHNVELINGNTIINGLSVGNGVPKDTDYFISQYVSGNEETTTASTKNNYFRRPFSLLWDYIKNKLNEAKVTLAKGLSVSEGLTVSGGSTLNGGLTVDGNITNNGQNIYLFGKYGRLRTTETTLQLESWKDQKLTIDSETDNRTLLYLTNANDIDSSAYLKRVEKGKTTQYKLYGQHNVTSGTTECNTTLASGNIYFQYQ